MRYIVKRAAAGAVLGGSLFAIGGIGVANAAPPVNLQDGLVNVDVGNVAVAKDVNATVAAQVVAALCGTNVGGVDVNALANQVDQNGNAQTIANCTLPGGPVSVTQNAGSTPGNSHPPGQMSAPGQNGTAPGQNSSAPGQNETEPGQNG